MVIDCRTGAETLKDAFALTPLSEAVMVALPSVLAAARPSALTVRTFVAEVSHFTAIETSCAVPSVYLPVATNFCVVPSGMSG